MNNEQFFELLRLLNDLKGMTTALFVAAIIAICAILAAVLITALSDRY